MRARSILGLVTVAVFIRGVVACGDDSQGGGTSNDGGSGSDATVNDASAADGSSGDDASSGDDSSKGDGGTLDASDAADAFDAFDAGDPNYSVTGIWQGYQGGFYMNAWTVLVALIPGAETAPPGATVGVVTYPSLGCGGPLTVLQPDAGIDTDAGLIDDRDGGDAGVVAHLVLHEDDNPGCVDGTDYFTLLTDGTLRLEWTDGVEHDRGSMMRVGTAGGSPPLTGVWAEPSQLITDGLHPLLAAVTHTDTNGAGSGVFLLRGDTNTSACGGLWTVTQGAGTSSLTLTETFPEGQVGCSGVYAASLMSASDGGATYTRSMVLDAGPDGSADGAAGPFSLQRLSP